MKLRFLCLLLTSFTLHASQPLKVDVSAESAILMNADTGAILYEKNSRMPQYPASTTKIATGIYALKIKGNALDDIVTAEQESIASIKPEAKRKANYKNPAYWVETGSSHIGIKKGEKMPLRALLYGSLIATANDASNVIAQHVSGSIPEFVNQLNAYVQELGCKDTHFCNPHGLHHPDHKTTAYDLAWMTREALKNPTFLEIVGTVQYMRPKTNKQEPTVMAQTNRLLKKGPYYYPKAIGVKTGYTSAARHNLVAAARHNGRTLIAVIMNENERNNMFKTAIDLFEAAFNQPQVEKVLIPAGQQPFVLDLPGAAQPAATYVEQAVTLQYYPAEEPQIKALLVWEKEELPIRKGDQIGRIELKTGDGRPYKTVPLLAVEDVHASWSHRLSAFFGGYGLWLLGAIVGAVLLFIFWNRSKP
jgi:D-alanyl-D-alanine carboxypeptidase (penicillin-binding protein 5/6)